MQVISRILTREGFIQGGYIINMFAHSKFARSVVLFAVVLTALLAIVMVVSPENIVQGKAAAQSTSVTGLDNDPNLISAVQQATVAHRGQQISTPLYIHVLKSDATWAFGTIAVAAQAQSEGGPESYLFIAKLTTHWEAAIEFTVQFEQWLSQVPQNVVSANEKQVLDTSGSHIAGDGSAQLGFPFPIGERWTYTGGPHHYCGDNFAQCRGGSDRPWSSLEPVMNFQVSAQDRSK